MPPKEQLLELAGFFKVFHSLGVSAFLHRGSTVFVVGGRRKDARGQHIDQKNCGKCDDDDRQNTDGAVDLCRLLGRIGILHIGFVDRKQHVRVSFPLERIVLSNIVPQKFPHGKVFHRIIRNREAENVTFSCLFFDLLDIAAKIEYTIIIRIVIPIG